MAVLDIPGIKTQIKSVLDTANTTTGSPIDLSNGLTTRVQKVLTYNVEMIPIQPSFFPCVTVFTKEKDVESLDMAVNALIGRRKITLNMSIVGLVWVDTMTSGFELRDLAEDQVEKLMENVEQVLRSDPTIGGAVNFSHPTKVTYHTFSMNEGAVMRAAIMNLMAKVIY